MNRPLSHIANRSAPGNMERQAIGSVPGLSYLVFLASLLTLALVGCKGFIVNPTLTAITVTPSTPTVTAGSTEQMAATGTFNDGSTKIITSSATWASSDT